jgi:branched-chain amino acid transport system substrate-binding protein
MRKRWLRGSVAAATVVGVATLGLATAGAAGAAGAVHSADPGVTDKQVTIGYIYSGTGVASSEFSTANKACDARVKRQNKAGGVNGRKINVVAVDDQSSGANLTATKDLIQNRNAFIVVNNSSFGFLSYRTNIEDNVPMVGGGYDGDYYGRPGNEIIFNSLGTPFTGISNDATARLMKLLGATKTAAVAYGVSPSSSASAQTLQDLAVPPLGMKAVYTNKSVDFGSTDVGPIVLGIKNSGADAVYLPLVESSNIAIVESLQQNNVPMKANILATGYGQDFLDSPVAKTLDKHTIVFQTFKPVEVKDKGTKQFQADLKKYEGMTGVPNFGDYMGYITCDVAILGLQKAGANPTRASFVSGLRTVSSYDQAGLACQPLTFDTAHYGKFPNIGCEYAMYVKNGKFVIINKGKPIVGKAVGPADLLASSTYTPAPGQTAGPITKVG